MKYVMVKFTNYACAKYEFICDLDEELEIGDLVVVHTTNGYSCAKVTDLNTDGRLARDYIVCKIDYKEFEEKHKGE